MSLRRGTTGLIARVSVVDGTVNVGNETDEVILGFAECERDEIRCAMSVATLLAEWVEYKLRSQSIPERGMKQFRFIVMQRMIRVLLC